MFESEMLQVSDLGTGIWDLRVCSVVGVHVFASKVAVPPESQQAQACTPANRSYPDGVYSSGLTDINFPTIGVFRPEGHMFKANIGFGDNDDFYFVLVFDPY